MDDKVFTTEEYDASEHEDTKSDEGESLAKKRYNYTLSLNTKDDMLCRYRHVRKDINNDKPEFYKIANNLASTTICQKKIKVAICIVANALLKRNWKPFRAKHSPR